jgi:hypothetical protein
MSLAPAQTAESLRAQIAAKTKWLDDFGQGSRRARPQHEIDQRKHELAALKSALDIVTAVALG